MGEKNRTLPMKENSEASWTNFKCRNLRKNDLGAVIFGCKNHTYDECVMKQMFGLPAPHFAYVKNVSPGLMLFLFNYSDRKLHGVFEAASPGKLNINQYAWVTSEGTDRSPYAAQVRVHVRRQCRPLLEEEFRPIIARNYYAERLFRFELDKDQAARLSKLFLSSPLPKTVPRPPKSNQWNHMFVHSRITKMDGSSNEALEETSGIGGENLKLSSEISCISFNRSYDAEKKWADLFKASSFSSTANNEESPSANNCNMEWELGLSFWAANKSLPEACSDAADAADSSVPESWEEHDVADNDGTCARDNETYNHYSDLSHAPSSEEMTLLVQSGLNSVGRKTNGEAFRIIQEPEKNAEQQSLAERADSDQNISIFESEQLDANVNLELVILKLVKEIKGLKTSMLKQERQIYSLQHTLVNSNLEIGYLKKRCSKLESAESCAGHPCDEDKLPSSRSNESIYIIGGFDGCSWLASLDIYSPSLDNLISRSTMTSMRSYAFVSKLNDEIFVFGGVHDGVWYDTVESYNPTSDQWTQWPSLNQKKGSMAGASMYEKIYAIGGGNGVDCFSEVEIFDPYVVRWLSSQSMLEKRFAPAAAEMSGALFVTGGYDGRGYLRSVERFDPREPTWTSMGSMNSKRGCHSLIVFEEKLYALGGYDGSKMVSTFEVLDPRVGVWTMAESMTVPRGYFGSFSFGGKLYAVGGVDGGEVLDLIECYEKGSGWQASGLKGLGKRCFFSTVVF